MLARKIERVAITACQQRMFVGDAAHPHRPDRMDDRARFQIIAMRDFGVARVAAAERAAFLQQFGSCGAVDRAVDSAAAEQR